MKKKFKIIFAVVVVMAMLFAFAISSSASTYDSLGSLESGYLSSSINNGYYFYRIVAGNGYYDVAYFATSDSSFYDAFGRYDFSIEEVNAFLDEENEFYDEYFWHLDFVIDYPVFFELMDNDYDLGLFGEVEQVKSAYKVYSALKFGYTQSELDSALVDATKDMYTQEQLEISVAQALKDAGLAFTDDTVLYLIQSSGYSGSTTGMATSAWTFDTYTLYYFSDGSVGLEYIVVDGAKAFYADVTANVENKELIFDYFVSKNDSFSSESWLSDPSKSEGLYNCVAESLVAVPSEEDFEAKYNEGKLDGVTEYKESQEYITVINNSYSNGYTTGVSDYKSSDAYATALSTQYATGKTAGVSEYKASSEYSNILKAEYNEGYDAGVTDTRGENTKNELTKLLSVFIGILGFGVLLMGALSLAGVFKKKKKARR